MVALALWADSFKSWRCCAVRMASHDVIFQASLPTKKLKEVFSGTKTISPTLTLMFNSEGAPIRFWCRDAREQCAVNGFIDADAFEYFVAENLAYKLSVDVKQALDALAIFTPGKPVEISVLVDEEDQPFIAFEQTLKDDAGDKRLLRVSEADDDDEAYAPKTEDQASAIVDLKMLARVLQANKKNSDVATVTVDDFRFKVSVDTRQARDEWQHPAVTGGNAEALVNVPLFLSLVNGAKNLGGMGDVFIYPNMIRVEAVDEHIAARFYMAQSEPIS